MGVYRRGKLWCVDYYAGPKRYREMVGPNRREAEAALGKRLGEMRKGMVMKKSVILLVLTLVLTACASTGKHSTIDNANKKTKGMDREEIIRAVPRRR